MNIRFLSTLCFTLLLITACGAPVVEEPPATLEEVAEPTEPAPPPEPTVEPSAAPSPMEETSMPFEISSTAFVQEEPIPIKYSCDGEDISPPLSWGDPPEGTQSFTLVMDDPDAPVGVWDHWIVINLPAEVRELPEDMPLDMKFGDVSPTFGKNSWGRNDYGGPCPPGGTHRYFFKLYALDTSLNLDDSAGKKQVLAAMEGHILAETELMGTFSR